jgi:hypothetical protein
MESMFSIKVKPIDEHNVEGVLELLNSYKSNLSALLLQYDNIIETYLKIIGTYSYGKANVNEVILPEIEILLNKYNCEFTSKGICSNGKLIFYTKFSKNFKKEIIQIEDGDNICNISKEKYNNGGNGLEVIKEINDVSNLNENVKEILSPYALQQMNDIHHLNTGNPIKYKYPLKSISMNVFIVEGIEVLKNVYEYYQVGDVLEKEKSILVYQRFNLDAGEPVMNYKRTIEISTDEVIPTNKLKDKLVNEKDRLSKEEFEKLEKEYIKRHTDTGAVNPPLFEKIDCKEKYYYYGENKLLCSSNARICYENKKLFDNNYIDKKLSNRLKS